MTAPSAPPELCRVHAVRVPLQAYPTRYRPAVTVLEPWASLLAWGVKTVETRPWRTRHRGWLWVHAGRNTDVLRRLGRQLDPAVRALAAAGMPCRCGHPHPHLRSCSRCPCRGYDPDWRPGHVVGRWRVRDAVPIVTTGAPHGPERLVLAADPTRCQLELWHGEWPVGDLSGQWPWGDWRPGRFAWLGGDAEPCEPTPARGRQGVWRWEP